jgi:hypothetical protein
MAFDLDRGWLEIAATQGDGTVRHWRREGEAWQPAASIEARTALPPALAVDPGGVLHLVVVREDGSVAHARHRDGRWEAPVSLGAASQTPPALAYNLFARALELVVVGPDGGLQHNRYREGSWTGWEPIGILARETPALGTSLSGDDLDVLAAALNGSLVHRRLTRTGGWQPAVILPTTGHGTGTLGRPALAVGPTGGLEVAITAPDGAVLHTRRVAGRWQGWQDLGIRAMTGPALLYNTDADSLELVATAPDGGVTHLRQVNGVWTLGGALGGTATGAPALVQGAGGDLELAVAGADGALYLNRFLPRAPGMVSFAREVQPLLDAHCTGCHEGPRPPEGLNLTAAHSYSLTVNTSSRQARRVPRVAPGQPERSYLYLKLTGAHAAAGGSGTQMPPDFPLPETDLARIRAWIEQGALGN